ncbi:hypothetical protein [Naasia aerilata]|nr:hypothetical protein [Naasia aerilata]
MADDGAIKKPAWVISRSTTVNAVFGVLWLLLVFLNLPGLLEGPRPGGSALSYGILWVVLGFHVAGVAWAVVSLVWTRRHIQPDR